MVKAASAPMPMAAMVHGDATRASMPVTAANCGASQ